MTQDNYFPRFYLLFFFFVCSVWGEVLRREGRDVERWNESTGKVLNKLGGLVIVWRIRTGNGGGPLVHLTRSNKWCVSMRRVRPYTIDFGSGANGSLSRWSRVDLVGGTNKTPEETLMVRHTWPCPDVGGFPPWREKTKRILLSK